MKRSLLLIAVLGALASPAWADSKFQPIPHSTAVVLSPGTTQADVDAQVRANNALGRATYDSIARRGGCNADVVPVTITAYCWDADTKDANPTGGPVGGSTGGSD